MLQFIKNHAVLICLAISATLIIIATALYPGGTMFDKNTTGFIWTQNFISNLFAEKALNGQDNPAWIWATIGVAFHSLGSGLFFINMSRKMSDKHTVSVLKIIGYANVSFNFLVATSLHDIIVTLSSTVSMLGLFYITVFVIKSKLHFLKICCIAGMLLFYYTLFLYGTGNWPLLAIMQKVSFTGSMLLILGLEYFTKREDFLL